MGLQPLRGLCRYLAFVLDTALIVFALVVLSYFASFLLVEDRERFSAAALLPLLLIPAAFIYFMVFEAALPGATPGRMIFRMRLVGRIADARTNWRYWLRAAARSVAAYLPFAMIFVLLQVAQAGYFAERGTPEEYLAAKAHLLNSVIGLNLLLLLLCMVGVTARRLPVHDLLLGTRVVWARETEALDPSPQGE